MESGKLHGAWGFWGRVHGRSQEFFSGGGTLFQKNIQKIFKKFLKNFLKFSKKLQKNLLRKLLKMPYFSLISKNLPNPAFDFCAFGRKPLCTGNF